MARCRGRESLTRKGRTHTVDRASVSRSSSMYKKVIIMNRSALQQWNKGRGVHGRWGVSGPVRIQEQNRTESQKQNKRARQSLWFMAWGVLGPTCNKTEDPTSKKQDAMRLAHGLAAAPPCAPLPAAGGTTPPRTSHTTRDQHGAGAGGGAARCRPAAACRDAGACRASPLPCARAARCALAQMRLASLTRVLVHTTIPRRRSKPYTAVRRISLPRITTHVCHPPTFASRHQRSQLASLPPRNAGGAAGRARAIGKTLHHRWLTQTMLRLTNSSVVHR